MGLDSDYINGQTPLDEDEKDGLLISTITTRGELDEFEQLNIQKAIEWTLKNKFNIDKILTEEFAKNLHKKMFDEVWKWAGDFRTTNKNIGVDKFMIGIEVKKLIDDCNFWIKNNAFSPDEISLRYSHRIVQIHLFPNGNGRHSRLIGDIIVNHVFNLPVFTWGRKDLVHKGNARQLYLEALRKADQGNYSKLLEFARM
ncbi:fic/DOC family protein [bacterium BMS3Abin04]|nr:fic/DOC family protein [bacterium BMS3Abin04]